MALRDISLVPPDIVEQRYVLRHLLFWAGILFISLLAIGSLYSYQNFIALPKTRTAAKLLSTHAHLKKTVDEIKLIQDELSAIKDKQSVLNEVTSNTQYSTLLWCLSDIINKNTWLSKLAVAKDEDGVVTMILTGFSYSNDELGDFLAALAREPVIGSAVLNYSKETTMAKSNLHVDLSTRLVQFQISCFVARE